MTQRRALISSAQGTTGVARVGSRARIRWHSPPRVLSIHNVRTCMFMSTTIHWHRSILPDPKAKEKVATRSSVSSWSSQRAIEISLTNLMEVVSMTRLLIGRERSQARRRRVTTSISTVVTESKAALSPLLRFLSPRSRIQKS